jgi:hypothetical protein
MIMNNELESATKEAVWQKIRQGAGIWLEELRKITKFSVRIVGVRTHTVTRHLDSRSQNCNKWLGEASQGHRKSV